MKLLRTLSHFITGIVFVFSGFVKAIDPLGSAYKFGDYFHAFGLDFLDIFSLPFAIFLSAIELVLGLVLLLGYQKKIAYWVLFVFMSAFTLLTFVLAISNPVSDCGCFGDALILTNWQTFFKNMAIMVFVLLLFSGRKDARNVCSPSIERVVILVLFSFSTVLSLYSLRHLPFIDFRPYAVSVNIQEAMEVPEGAELDEYRTVLFYRNIESEKISEFSIENYPKDTIRWEFVNSESKLVSKGYDPPIHDFGISDKYGSDLSDEFLSFEGYTLFLTSYNLDEANGEALAAANQWADLAHFSDDFQFAAVTSAGEDLIDEMTEKNALSYEFFIGDEIMLKTMVRSNPGFWLMKNGTIIAKWSHRDFPSLEKWNNKWTELIEHFHEEQDPEILQLIEEGFMDEMSWNMIDFDHTAVKFISEKKMREDLLKSWGLVIAFITFLLIGFQFLPKKEK